MDQIWTDANAKLTGQGPGEGANRRTANQHTKKLEKLKTNSRFRSTLNLAF